MALVIKKLYKLYFRLFYDLADTRTDDNLLVSTPLPIAGITMGYLYFVYKLGPKLMQDRKPMDIRKALIVYNSLQILANGYAAIVGFKRLLVVNWDCATVDYSNSPEGLLELHLASSFLYIKLFDLADTIFFVLRKSYRQVTFLHTYHHWGMLVTGYVGVRFLAGGHGIWILVVNSFVHVLMYFYYLLTSIDDSWKKNIRFKKLLTQIQLAQFAFFIFIYGSLVLKPDCRYPRIVSYLWLPQNVLMVLMFGDFYLKSYVYNKKSK